MAKTNNNQTFNKGMGPVEWVFIVFLTLKLGLGDTGVQDWSWWWVTAPIWGVAVVLFPIFLAREIRNR